MRVRTFIIWLAVMWFLIVPFRGFSNPANPVLDNSRSSYFVENRGQFDHRLPIEKVWFGHENSGQQVFFTRNKIYFNLVHTEKRYKSEAEKKERAERQRNGFSSPEEFAAFEKERHKMKITSDLLVAEWVGANPNAELIGSGRDEFTHTYEFLKNGELTSESGIPSFQKIIYKDLYPHIDLEYVVHPKSGVKYSLILHPGADVSQVRLRYSKTPDLQPDGSLLTPTRFGNMVDHPPVTFRQGTQNEIPSAYLLNGNEISFALGPFDPTETIVIDPWTDLPNDPGSNWNCAWECETDALGNTYAIFGAMPLQLRKYNAAGAIQWSYNTTYDTTSWLGTFVTDDVGNSYVTNGSTAALRKVSPAGVLIWSVGNISGQLLGEFWNIAFNCDQTKLITGGAGGLFNPEPYIYDIDINTGALLSAMQVHAGSGLLNSQEVRAVTATENGKYYWLSHDSIGFISQNFTNCPSPGAELKTVSSYDLGYKCENWRYNNTGVEALAYYGGFVFVNRGNRIDKREFATANIVATAPIPGGAFTSQFGGNFLENSGIVIDNNGNIFVGSRGSVSEFDQNLNLVGTYAVTGNFNVYDVDITSSGQVIACGATGTSGAGSRTGYVESLGVLAVGPFAMTCCDASICPQADLCETDSPVTLAQALPGGTWSSSAPGFNTVTGEFDPGAAGAGSYTFYYSLPCGTDSITLDVSACPTLFVCVEPNGDLSVTNGTGPYSWDEGTMVSSCPFGPGAGCNFLTHAVTNLTWTNFGSGATVTPPLGADTVRVTQPGMEEISWDISALPSCVVLPIELTVFKGEARAAHTNFLEWTTSLENNNHYFTLYHSSNGRDWLETTTQTGRGTTNQSSHYSFLDEEAFVPTTYYRLGQTDFDGNYTHLSSIVVHADQAVPLMVDVFPNPANKFANFTWLGSQSGEVPLRVSVLNAVGASVKEQSFSNLNPNSTYKLDISSLADGVYHLRFSQGGRSVYRKLLVMRGE